jgi:hypothetical protein
LIELAAEGRGWIKADLWAAKHGAPTAKAFSHVREVFNPSAGEAAAAGGPEVEVISIFGADTLKRVRNFKNKVPPPRLEAVGVSFSTGAPGADT